MINSSREYYFKLALIILIFSACLIFIRNVELTNAWNGWSPVGFTWGMEDNGLRDQRDFYHFVFKRDHLLNSIANWIYPFTYNYFSIEPPITQIAFIITTTFLYSFNIVFFLKTFVKGNLFLVSAIFAVALALFTNVIDCDFARFGQANLSLAQAYGVAIPLQLLALSMTFRKKPVWAGLTLGLLIFVHISLGIMTAVVIGAMMLSCLDKWKKPSVFAGLTILVFCSVIWANYISSEVSGSTSNVMDLKEWVEWERMMNYHYFPFDIGIFTNLHYLSISPFLSLLLLALSSATLSELPVTVRKMWSNGIIVSVLISFCGIIISVEPPSIGMVMLALHRASGITLLLLLPIGVWHLLDLFYRKNFTSSILGIACVMPAFLQKTLGIPTIPSLFVAALAFFCKDKALPSWQKSMLLTLSIITFGYTIFICTFGYAEPLEASILGNRYATILMFIVVLTRAITKKMEKLNYYRERISNSLAPLLHLIIPCFTIGAIIIILASSVYLNWGKYPTVPINLARSYLEAQLWAKSSTDQKAVFMPDPGMPAYGRSWSEYSRRASYGSLREWLHIPIVYHASLKGFNEGVRRLSFLGIDPYRYRISAFSTQDKNPMSKYYKLIEDARAAYYSMSSKQIIDLANKEGISYFIYIKNYLKPPPGLVTAYENNNFIILAPVYSDVQPGEE